MVIVAKPMRDFAQERAHTAVSLLQKSRKHESDPVHAHITQKHAETREKSG